MMDAPRGVPRTPLTRPNGPTSRGLKPRTRPLRYYTRGVSATLPAMPPALQFLILLVSGWVNRRQQDVIEYPKYASEGAPLLNLLLSSHAVPEGCDGK